jgi:hypothetical protein
MDQRNGLRITKLRQHCQHRQFGRLQFRKPRCERRMRSRSSNRRKETLVCEPFVSILLLGYLLSARRPTTTATSRTAGRAGNSLRCSQIISPCRTYCPF